MREGAYTKTNVSDLTGRYLNKAPIDPWGKPYVIDPNSGQVISSGPDRNDATPEDNIIVAYQPPLALVSAKWVDSNQSGAVDVQNVPDRLELTFSRKLLLSGMPGAPADAVNNTTPADVADAFVLSNGQAMNAQLNRLLRKTIDYMRAMEDGYDLTIGWIDFDSNKELFCEEAKKDCLCLFEDGTVVNYNEKHPVSRLTHFRLADI